MALYYNFKNKEITKMKVSLITILDNTNYGTYLQALATGMTIKSLGHEVEVIRYMRPCMTFWGNSKAVFKDRGLLRWFHRCIIKYSRKSSQLRKLDIDFLASYLPLTDEYVGFDALMANPPLADVYLTGSDQVWNSFYNRGIDKSYFLDFTPKGKKRICYAASIGMPSFPEQEKDETKRLLKNYHEITVRELSAKQILADMEISSEVVLDPTLLLNKEQWEQIAEKYTFTEDEPYLLTYSVEYGKEDSYIKHYAKKIAEKKGLKLYHITYGGKPFDNYYDKVYSYATPDKFLNLMLHASFVVVSSFHGTAFSINFNKSFITVSPKKFNSRIMSLLEITGLKSRMVTDSSSPIESFDEIDYSSVNRILDGERMKSIKILSKMLKD